MELPTGPEGAAAVVVGAGVVVVSGGAVVVAAWAAVVDGATVLVVVARLVSVGLGWDVSWLVHAAAMLAIATRNATRGQ